MKFETRTRNRNSNFSEVRYMRYANSRTHFRISEFFDREVHGSNENPYLSLVTSFI